jgi:hypothetical protein
MYPLHHNFSSIVFGLLGEKEMAKGADRGHREPKKPKASKKTAPAAKSSFIPTTAAVLPTKSGHKPA